MTNDYGLTLPPGFNTNELPAEPAPQAADYPTEFPPPPPAFHVEAPKLIFCQNCGEPLPDTTLPVDARASKVQDLMSPNKTILGRVDIRFRCPSCRSKIVLIQRHYTNFEAAQRIAADINKNISEGIINEPATNKPASDDEVTS